VLFIFVLKKSMKINTLEKININNSEQWILVRGNTADAPLFIHVQAGPGLPLIPEAGAMEKLLHLEDNFLVVYWDQRGCGKAFNKNINPETINIFQLTDDVIECTKYLLNKYNKDKAILSGYSIGAVLSLLAANKDSSIISRLFLTSMDIDIPAANKYALEFAMAKAKEKNNRRLVKQVENLIDEPILKSKIFQERARLLTDLGGIKSGSSYNALLLSTIKNMFFSKEYSLKDIFKTIKGMEFCQNALLPEMDKLNLFDMVNEVNVPVHFIQGKSDGVAPYQTAVRYFDYLRADTKTMTLFEHSAHMPHYDEPQKFVELVIEKKMSEL
jgi:pimeloyl-ACP methyl ester carboxylesterase